MIGQENLLRLIQKQIENDTFPKFSIIVGPKGSGKKTLVRSISSILGSRVFTTCNTTIDAIRSVISEAHRLNGVTSVYMIADADNMSVQAKNALLKITEEPPKSAYFIMTLEDINNTLDTIKSRGSVFYVEPYTKENIREYLSKNDTELFDLDWDDAELIVDLCETPGEANQLLAIYFKDFYEYVELTVGKLTEVSLANALKVADKIALKDDSEKYDLKLFWKAVLKVCGERMIEEPEYLEWVRITSKALRKLSVRGINKQMLFDNWVFEIRDWR